MNTPAKHYSRTTLCFLINNSQVLLAMKKRGFGVGKWNGTGGKVIGDESVEQAAKRETKEASKGHHPTSRKKAIYLFQTIGASFHLIRKVLPSTVYK